MEHHFRSLAVILGTCLFLSYASIGLAQSKCDAGKLKEYGKKVFCLAKVDSKAAKKGEPIDTARQQKCMDKFILKCAKAEEKGDCTLAVKSCAALADEAEVCREAANEEPTPTPTDTPTETPTETPTDTPTETPTYTIDFCRLQFPLVINDVPGANVTVYGRLYVAGLTDQSEFNDPAPGLQAWVGYGPDGSEPAVDLGWTWFPAIPNPGWIDGLAGNDDEYQAFLDVPAPGTYDYAYRFSGDSGATFTYCDGDAGGSTTGYMPADAGQMTSAL